MQVRIGVSQVVDSRYDCVEINKYRLNSYMTYYKIRNPMYLKLLVGKVGYW